jgi:hypothetical protein
MRDKYDDLGDYVIAYLQETPKHRFDTVTKLGVSLRAKGIKVPQNDLAPKAKVRISRQQNPLRQTRRGSSLDRRSCTPMRPLPSMDGAATTTAAHVVTDHPACA